MKRSSQVALVLMGVTATTAAGAYMLPSRPECRPAAASTAADPPVALPQAGAAAAQAEPCRRRRWGGWYWGAGSYNSNRSRPAYSGRAPTSVSTAVRPSGASGRSTSAPSATPSASRGGFGSTSRSMSSRSSGS